MMYSLARAIRVCKDASDLTAVTRSTSSFSGTIGFAVTSRRVHARASILLPR